jgi:hypothetical protein
VLIQPPRGVFSPVEPSDIVWLGDSIVAGSGSLPQTPPKKLSELLAKPVLNAGVGGNTTAQCATRWNSSYAGGYRTLVWSCGVNDVAGGLTGAAAAARAIAVLDDAKARGMQVLVTGIMPWKNSAGWDSAKQAEGETYNALVQAWASSNSSTYVDTASLGGGGGDPLVIAAAYDSGDQIHPNGTGGTLALATLVWNYLH